ncbi:hypothetical protein BT69DRAFT_91654 [Atractiella rhizophila]|nr:hypothetical protein BT69DRAFT_91654 [Atractiella rhizophila]
MVSRHNPPVASVRPSNDDLILSLPSSPFIRFDNAERGLSTGTMSGPGTPLLSSVLHHATASNPNILPISIPPQTPTQHTAPAQNSNAPGSKGGAGAGGGGGSGGGGGAGGKKRKAGGDADDDGGKKRTKTPRACDSCRRKKISN